MIKKLKTSFVHIKEWELWPIHFGIFLISSSLCLHLQNLGSPPVLAAAITGLLGTFLPSNRYIEKLHIEAAFYTGAFVAMDLRFVHAGPRYVFWASLIGATLYFLMSPFFRGFGGRLGTIAFITSVIAWFLGKIVL